MEMWNPSQLRTPLMFALSLSMPAFVFTPYIVNVNRFDHQAQSRGVGKLVPMKPTSIEKGLCLRVRTGNTKTKIGFILPWSHFTFL